MASRYCNECLVHAKQHCAGKRNDETTATNNVRVTYPDGSHEINQDYIQTGVNCDRLHGLNFCSQYEFNPAMLPKIKSAQAIRDEFNAKWTAVKVAAKAQKADERKLKAKNRRDKKAIKQAEQAAEQVAMSTTTQTANAESELLSELKLDDDFSDLII